MPPFPPPPPFSFASSFLKTPAKGALPPDPPPARAHARRSARSTPRRHHLNPTPAPVLSRRAQAPRVPAEGARRGRRSPRLDPDLRDHLRPPQAAHLLPEPARRVAAHVPGAAAAHPARAGGRRLAGGRHRRRCQGERRGARRRSPLRAHATRPFPHARSPQSNLRYSTPNACPSLSLCLPPLPPNLSFPSPLQVDKASDLFISLYNMGRSPQVRTRPDLPAPCNSRLGQSPLTLAGCSAPRRTRKRSDALQRPT